MITLTKWQRLIAVIAAFTCLCRAVFLFSDNESAGSAFIAGIALAMLSFSPARSGENLFPDLRLLLTRYMIPWLTKHWRKLTAVAFIAAIFLVGSVIVESRHQAEKQAREEKEYQNWVNKQQGLYAAIEAEYRKCMKRAYSKDQIEKILSESDCKYKRDEGLKPIF